MTDRPMFEKRIWGEYQVLDYRVEPTSLTKRLTLHEGKAISYQTHRFRDEIWTFTDGEGELILDGQVRPVRRGDTAYIRAGVKHSVRALTELNIIEVQLGEILSEDDIERYDFSW